MNAVDNLHNQALQIAKRYRHCEAELLDVLTQIDAQRAYAELGYPSLFRYATDALELTEAQAFAFISVSRKARELPPLKKAIETEGLSVAKASRIVSVISERNPHLWIEKAKTLSKHQLEKEVAALKPIPESQTRIKPISESRSEIRVTVSFELESALKRVRDLLAQSERRHCDLEKALGRLVSEFLDRHDPVRKASRAKTESEKREEPAKIVVRRNIPASVRHQVNRRDLGKCTYVAANGRTCGQERWVEMHHCRPWSKGGDHTAENVVTLCRVHHRLHHGSTGN